MHAFLATPFFDTPGNASPAFVNPNLQLHPSFGCARNNAAHTSVPNMKCKMLAVSRKLRSRAIQKISLRDVCLSY